MGRRPTPRPGLCTSGDTDEATRLGGGTRRRRRGDGGEKKPGDRDLNLGRSFRWRCVRVCDKFFSDTRPWDSRLSGEEPRWTFRWDSCSHLGVLSTPVTGTRTPTSWGGGGGGTLPCRTGPGGYRDPIVHPDRHSSSLLGTRSISGQGYSFMTGLSPQLVIPHTLCSHRSLCVDR